MQLPLPTNSRAVGYSTWRAWLGAIIAVMIALMASETLLLQGVVQPVVIEGCSMAPVAMGPHCRTTCPGCEHEFAVAANQIPAFDPLTCPDCQGRFPSPGSNAPLERGRRVLVNRLQLALTDPQRWDVVVLRCPHQADHLCIKRVLGLPGEQIDFAQGDLLVNRQVVRKSLDQQIRVRQLVHRERDTLRLWDSANPAWQWRDGGWQFQGAGESLVFAPPGGKVTNLLGINQRAPVAIYAPSDLMLSYNLALGASASVRLRARFDDGQTITSSPIVASQAQVVWSLFDRQMLLVVDGQVVTSQQRPTAWPGQPQLSIEARGQATLSDLCVWRDIHYHTRVTDFWPQQGGRLSPSQFFVVGDNVAISEDSRGWPAHGVDRRLLIGIPLSIK